MQLFDLDFFLNKSRAFVKIALIIKNILKISSFKKIKYDELLY